MPDIALFDRRLRVTLDTIEFDALDVEFRAEKTLKVDPNTLDLTVYNLTRDHQAQLEQLQELKPAKGTKLGKAAQTQATKGIPCRIEAGYRDGMSLIWLGDLRTCQTTKQGSDWVTHLTSGDGAKAWANARLHVSYGPKTGIDTALRAIVRALGVGEGNLSQTVAKLKIAGSATWKTGKVFAGSASRQLTDFARSAGLEVSIQDGALQFLDKDKALSGTAIRIARETGMVDSPTVDNTGIVTVKTSIIPDIKVGGLMTIDAVRVKGTYRIERAVWQGVRNGGDWVVEMQGRRY